MKISEAKFNEHISRLQKVQMAISEILLRKGPPTFTSTSLDIAEQNASDTTDPIEKCLKEVEKLVREGKVMSAIEKQNECEKLIANAQP